jgi:Spy/CpxP family protein refolding chaperone
MMWRGLVTGVLVLSLGMPAILWAQAAGSPPGLSCGSPLQELGLSPEQEGALRDIDRSFQGQLRGLRSRLLAKRLEFKAALGNPQVGEETIRTKAEELRRLWSQCQETTTDYYLKIRAVLTPEQQRKWFSVNPLCSPLTLEKGP